MEVSPDQLKQAVELQHGGTATFLQFVPVHEEHYGQTVWDGAVAVFELKGQPGGMFRAYAWSHAAEGGNRRFFAMLHGGSIKTPRDAVHAAIVAERSGA